MIPLVILLTTVGLALGTAAQAQSSPTPLPRSTPEAHGISSRALAALYADAEQQLDALHSLMVVRHGSVVAEGWWAPYGPSHPHELYSLSKSFTSTAIGLAVTEGLLGLDDPVLSFFPEDAPPELSDNLKAMRIRDLLAMSTGHTEDTLGPMFEASDGNFAKAFLARPVTYKPGTHFLYNTGATYMLSAILQRRAGVPLLAYLEPRLFHPLSIVGATWESCPRGINFGGFGLSVKTEDIARLGQLYLQQGMWQGRQLLPASWVAQATSRQASNGSNPESDWEQGYGYQFWRCRHGAFRGDGAFGQFCLVLPEQETVVAVTAGVKDMQAVLNLLWQDLLPALQGGMLPEDTAAQQALRDQLAHLSLAPQAGQPTARLARRVSGARYAFVANDQQIDSLAFAFGRDSSSVTLWQGAAARQLTVGHGRWALGTTAFDSEGPRPVAVSGAWTSPDTYALRLCFYETPYIPTIRCRFTPDGVLLDREDNVSFGPTARPQLAGQRRVKLD